MLREGSGTPPKSSGSAGYYPRAVFTSAYGRIGSARVLPGSSCPSPFPLREGEGE
jgi:hypothetical protein